MIFLMFFLNYYQKFKLFCNWDKERQRVMKCGMPLKKDY